MTDSSTLCLQSVRAKIHALRDRMGISEERHVVSGQPETPVQQAACFSTLAHSGCTLDRGCRKHKHVLLPALPFCLLCSQEHPSHAGWFFVYFPLQLRMHCSADT